MTAGGILTFGLKTLPVEATGVAPFETAVAVAFRNGERLGDFATTFIFTDITRKNEPNEANFAVFCSNLQQSWIGGKYYITPQEVAMIAVKLSRNNALTVTGYF